MSSPTLSPPKKRAARRPLEECDRIFREAIRGNPVPRPSRTRRMLGPAPHPYSNAEPPMSRRRTRPLAMLLLGTLLSGCDSASSASKSNFAKVIAATIADDERCLTIHHTLPQDFTETHLRAPVQKGGPPRLERVRPNEIETLEALTAAGLLHREDRTVMVRDTAGGHELYAMLSFDDRPTIQATLPIYTLSPLGRAVYRQGKEHPRVGNSEIRHASEFCFSPGRELVEVLHFTEPAELLGRQSSTVRYTWQLRDVAAWATHPALHQAFRGMDKLVGSTAAPAESKAVLVLTTEGWKHADQI